MLEQCVFISYSRSAADPARQGLQEILDALTAQHFQRSFTPGQPRCILIDDAIKPGDFWRERLYEWLEQCDHAIIYCSPDVTQASPQDSTIFERKNWLFHEASVLAHRRHMGTLKELIPVYAYVEMEQHPFAKLDALYLRRFQAVFFRDEHDRRPVIARIVERLCATNGATRPPSGGVPARVMEYRDHTEAWLKAFAPTPDNRQLQLQTLINLTPKTETDADPDYFNRRMQAAQLQRDLATRLLMGPCLSPPGWDRPRSYYRTYCAELRRLCTKGYTATKQVAGVVARDVSGLYDITDALSTSWVRAETAMEIGQAMAREDRVFWVKVDTGPDGNDPEEMEAAERLYPQLLRDLIVASYRAWHNLVDFGGKTDLRDLADVFSMADQPYKDPVKRYISLEAVAHTQHVVNAVLDLPLDTPPPQQRPQLRKLRQRLEADYHELRVVVDVPREQQSFFVRQSTLDLTALQALRQQLPSQVFFCIVTPAAVTADQSLDQGVVIEVSAIEYQAAQALHTTLEELHETLSTGQAG